MSRLHVNSEELLAFALEGESLPLSAYEHLASCPLCQQKVVCSRKMIAYLVPHLYRSCCPSAAMLSYYALPNALSAEEQRKIAEHLAHCPLCATEYAEARQFLETS